MSIEDNITSAENGTGDHNAKNPNSTAQGDGQFINSTWLSVVKQHRPDLAKGMSDDDILAMRADPALSKQMTAAYAADNNSYLTKNGVPVTAGNTYLAHFAGPQGAVGVISADPSAPVKDILGAKVVAANPFLKDMTAGDLQAWASKKMGVTAKPGNNGGYTAPAVQQPIFANQPAAASATAAQASAPSMPTMQGMPSQPIFASQQQAPSMPQVADNMGGANTQQLAQVIARLRQSSPIFAGVQNILKGNS